MTIEQILVVIGLVAFLIGFYALGIYLNRRTPLPEGCELPSMACESCSSSACGYSEPNRGPSLKEEIKQEIKLMKSKKEGGIDG